MLTLSICWFFAAIDSKSVYFSPYIYPFNLSTVFLLAYFYLTKPNKNDEEQIKGFLNNSKLISEHKLKDISKMVQYLS